MFDWLASSTSFREEGECCLCSNSTSVFDKIETSSSLLVVSQYFLVQPENKQFGAVGTRKEMPVNG